MSDHGRTVKLHHLWDGLLIEDEHAGYGTLDIVVTTIQRTMRYGREALKEDLKREGFADWVKDSANLARKVAYDGGNLKGANAGAHHDEGQLHVPPLPGSYLDVAREVAKRQAALAGFRLSAKLKTLFGE